MYTPVPAEPPRWLQDIRSLASDANHLGATYISSSHIQRDYLLHVLDAINTEASAFVFQAEADQASAGIWKDEADRLLARTYELDNQYARATNVLGAEQFAHETTREMLANALADAASLRSNNEALAKANAYLADDVDKFTANIRELELDLGEVQDALEQNTQLHANIVGELRGELNLFKALDIVEGFKESLQKGAKAYPALADRLVAAVHEVRDWQPETIEVATGEGDDDDECLCGGGGTAGCRCEA